MMSRRLFSSTASAIKLPGWRATGVTAGIKASGKPDMAFVASDRPAICAAVFTTNRVIAAPCIATRNVLESSAEVRSLILNSGCANACTGEQGIANANRMSELAGNAAAPGSKALVFSTGIIGHQLPMEKIENGIKLASSSLSEEGWEAASRAFMTTDTFPKLIFRPSGSGYGYIGISKGAGMIMPNMATMLGLVVSDINISTPLLRKAVRRAADNSFNCISVDNDTSTNDTFAVMANGASGLPQIVSESSPEYIRFEEELVSISTDLAKLIVRDGEGATKFVSVMVRGAASKSDAAAAARSVATSSLVKCALYGQDPNWGRVTAAVGRSSAEVVDQSKLSLWFAAGDATRNKTIQSRLLSSLKSTPAQSSGAAAPADAEASEYLQFLSNGRPIPIAAGSEQATLAKRIMASKDITIVVDMGLSQDEANSSCQWTCDLTDGYVRENSEYTT